MIDNAQSAAGGGSRSDGPSPDKDVAGPGGRDHPQSWGEANQSADDSWDTTEDTNQPKEPSSEED